MVKRFASMAGVLALALSTFVGCADSSVNPDVTASSVGAGDPYSYLKMDQSVYADFSEVPTAGDVLTGTDFMMNPPGRDSLRGGDDSLHHPPGPPRGGDSLHHPPGPPPDSLHGGDSLHHPPGPPPDSTHGGRDTTKRGPLPPKRGNFGRMVPGSYERVIKQLHLTAEQDAQVKVCFTEFRDCANAAAQSYAQNRNALADALNTQLRSIRAQVDAGTMTSADAKTAIQAAIATYRSGVDSLNTSNKAAQDTCRSTFETCVKSHLTAEQAATWDSLVRR